MTQFNIILIKLNNTAVKICAAMDYSEMIKAVLN